MCILYCCEGRKLDNYWVITSPSLNKEYCIVLYCIVLYCLRHLVTINQNIVDTNLTVESCIKIEHGHDMDCFFILQGKAGKRAK